jgi:hypothetical protein
LQYFTGLFLKLNGFPLWICVADFVLLQVPEDVVACTVKDAVEA